MSRKLFFSHSSRRGDLGGDFASIGPDLLQGHLLAQKAMGPVLFDHLPSAFGIPQEAYHAPHSTNEARESEYERDQRAGVFGAMREQL